VGAQSSGSFRQDVAETGTAGLECPTATSRRSFMGTANGSSRPQAAVMRPQRLQPESTRVCHWAAAEQFPKQTITVCLTGRIAPMHEPA
jgi:hypothetical protein